MSIHPETFQKKEFFSLKSFKERKLLSLLAYETGTHLGDGHLGYNYDKQDNKWRYILQYTGDIVNEYDFYVNVLKPTLEKLYNYKVKISNNNRDNTCLIKTQKESICRFKQEIGLPIGKKREVVIPPFINNKQLKAKFLRGFADTDFCLSFRIQKKRDYPIISTKLADPILLSQLHLICKRLGLNPYSIFGMKSRNINVKGGFSIVHGLFLYGQENLYKWVDRVGFSSSKHLTKFLLWEKTGKSFPKTTTAQRYELLKRLGQRVVLSPL